MSTSAEAGEHRSQARLLLSTLTMGDPPLCPSPPTMQQLDSGKSFISLPSPLPIHTGLFPGASRRGSSSSSERSALSILMVSHASPTSQISMPLEPELAPVKRPPHPPDVITSNPGNSISRSPDMILSSGTDDNSFDELVTPLSEDPPERPTNRVRFRSRVRITSGFNRHRHRPDAQDYLSLTPSSSLSGSPSSSISAPLRSHPEDEVAKPGWGTLGQRVSLLAQGGPLRKKQRREAEMYAKNTERGMVVAANVNGRLNERTPLLNASASPLYINGDVNGTGSNSSLDEGASISREVDLIFGPWPNRLLNHHWWWWHVEPVVCCRCLSDSDDEG